MSTTVKIQCAVTPDFHVRKIKVSGLSELRTVVSQWFLPVIDDLKADQLIFDYVDEDGDEVRVDSETEWKDLCQNNTEPGKPVRIRVRRVGFDHFNGVPLPLPVAGATQTNFDFTRGSVAAFAHYPAHNNNEYNNNNNSLSGSTSVSNYPSPQNNNNNNNQISAAPPLPPDVSNNASNTTSPTTSTKSASILQKERELRLVEDDAEERKRLAELDAERKKQEEEKQKKANEELKKELERQEKQRLEREKEKELFERAKQLAIEKANAERAEQARLAALAEEERKKKEAAAEEERRKKEEEERAAKKAVFIARQKEIEAQIEAEKAEKERIAAAIRELSSPAAVSTSTTTTTTTTTSDNNNNQPKRFLAKDLRPAYREALPLLSNLYKVNAEETILKMMGGAFRGAIRIQANLATSEINFVVNDNVLHEHVALRLQELLNSNEIPMACHIAGDFVRLYPQSSTGRYNYGVVLTKAQQFDTALAELQHAVYLGANATEARNDTDLAPLRKFMAFRTLGQDEEEIKKVTPLMEMFPEISFEQASKLIKKHKNDLDAAATEFLTQYVPPTTTTTTVGPRHSPW